MNYIGLINRFWNANEEHSFRPTTIALYFYLLKVNNGCSWKEYFKRNNKRIEADLDISYKSLCNARNQLKQAEMIDFVAKNGIANVTYSLTFGKKDEVRDEGEDEVKDEGGDEVRTRLGTSKDKPNKTKPDKKKNKKDFDFSFVESEFLELVEDFVLYREKDLKSPYKTERGVKAFYKKLLSLSGGNLQEAERLVDHAKDNEWKTVFPIKTEKEIKNEETSGDRQSEAERLLQARIAASSQKHGFGEIP